MSVVKIGSGPSRSQMVAPQQWPGTAIACRDTTSEELSEGISVPRYPNKLTSQARSDTHPVGCSWGRR